MRNVWAGGLRAAHSLPLWGRWVAVILLYLLTIAAVVLIVRGLAGGAGSATHSEADAQAQADREGRVAVAEDEAPHRSPLAPATSAAVALERAIGADVRQRIATGQLTGPLERVRCAASSRARAGRAAFDCTVTSAGISYPFRAIADQSTRELIWCKLDQPPTGDAALAVPVSPACRS